jgi:hypothetical protein
MPLAIHSILDPAGAYYGAWGVPFSISSIGYVYALVPTDGWPIIVRSGNIGGKTIWWLLGEPRRQSLALGAYVFDS